MSIESFLKKHKEAIRKRQKFVSLSIEEANLLANEILTLFETSKKNNKEENNEVLQIYFDAGSFKNK